MALVVVLAALLAVSTRPLASATSPKQRPHVVIIGIDSLRVDHAAAMSRKGELPNLARLLGRSAWFEDTTTPLARTFPAWLSILTGRGPESAGVVCNLMPRTDVAANPTLANLLDEAGYHTVFATDEVRFSNIDATYGFDQVVTPAIGASDFLIAQFGDIPLVNLVAKSSVGARLFPQLNSNRAVAYLYEPETFTERLSSSVQFDRPTLLAVHLTTPHWPYLTAHSQRSPRIGSGWDRTYAEYRESLKSTDRQLGDVIDWLAREGVLNNAIVVLLSDHGEALHRRGDSLADATADTAVRSLRVARTGHGSSVLSPVQFQVVLAFSAFGEAAGAIAVGTRATPAELADVTPTLLDLLNISPPKRWFEGLSLAAVLRNSAIETDTSARARFTETGFNIPSVLAGNLDAQVAATEGASYYSVNPETGYLELKKSSIAYVQDSKERAVIAGPWLLAALPDGKLGFNYVLARRDGTDTRIVKSQTDHPVLSSLWRSLSEKYGAQVGALPEGAVRHRRDPRS
jgi:hypothetical protein